MIQRSFIIYLTSARAANYTVIVGSFNQRETDFYFFLLEQKQEMQKVQKKKMFNYCPPSASCIKHNSKKF